MKGWKPIPLALKILFIVLVLWALMSLSVLFTMPDRKIAFFGFLLTGMSANIVVIILDLVL